ncbi:MAG: hypothetical protein ACK4SM_05415 [Aquificaceae bacterium]
MRRFALTAIFFLLFVYDCGGGGEESSYSVNLSEFIAKLEKENGISYESIKNDIAYIPPQCWTKTEGKFNPCYACHTNGKEPNYLNDSSLQLAYSFPDERNENPWKNLFIDKTERIKAISDEEILAYVRQSNYLGEDREIILKRVLPKNWPGYIPDCYFNFDEDGFDRNPKTGEYTGWRAFRYYPFLGTFFPTNGSTDDVLIRLPESFRQDEKGSFNKEVYKANLALVEAFIKQRDINTETINERLIGVDLDGNGNLSITTLVRFKPNIMFVGMAGRFQREGKLQSAPGLFPVGTEFLHTVRYIDWNDTTGNMKLANRMKEVRYAKKLWWADYNFLFHFANQKGREQFLTGEHLPESFIGNYKIGFENGTGWVYTGFIEDKKGSLRPQTNEELQFCMGCHSSLGATTDSSFSFVRKIEGKEGWLHWTQKDLKDINDLTVRYKGFETYGEYTFYLLNNKAGDEFRENQEVIQKFYNLDGTPKKDMFKKLRNDITVLLYPSKERALLLNKAYKILVEEQSFIYGRDTTVSRIKNVHRLLKPGEETGLKSPIIQVR